MSRAKTRAQDALESGNEKTAHIAKLLEELRALPAAPHGVSFKGGMAGDKGSLSYASTYDRRNLCAPYLMIDATNELEITTYAGAGFDNEDEGETMICKNQLEALGVISSFLGRVAPEREVEVVPAIARAATATRTQNQLKNDGSARWAAKPL